MVNLQTEKMIFLPWKKEFKNINEWKNNSRFFRAFKKNFLLKVSFLRGITVFFLILIIVYELNYIVFNTSFFKIRDIKVKGIKNSNYLTIINTLNLNLNMPLWEIKKNLKDNLPSLLKKEPWIKKVTYRIKNNKLILKIEERKPFLVSVADNGERFIISCDGTALIKEKNFKGNLENKIIITGLFSAVEHLGKKADKTKLELAKQWIDFLQKEKIGKIEEINLSDEYNFFFRLKNGIKVYVSSMEELKAKKKLLLKVLEKIKTERLLVKYIDLRTNGGLILKPY